MSDICTVGTPCLAYNDMCQAWDLIHDLLGGTRAMRAAGKRWLPQEPKEEDSAYKNRLARSFLFGKYKDTVKNLAEKPFSREITLKNPDGLDEQLVAIEKDADREKTNLTVFSQQAFQHAINYGKHHILVDVPTIPKDITLDDQRKFDLRPYWVHVTAPNLIGWKSETLAGGGGRMLTEIRIREYKIVEAGDDNYEQKLVEHIRVYRREEWILYREDENPTSKQKGYVEVARGKNTLGRIPLVTFYFDGEASFMKACPVLEDLAWMNAAHWQSNSDQRNILRVARLPILFFKGLTKDELQNLVVGIQAAIKSTSKDAEGKYIEHTGKAIEAGRLDLQDLESMMQVLSLQPEIENVPQKTATGEMIANGKSETALQAWVRREEHALEECYRISAEWIGKELPKDFSADIFSDFAIGGRSLQEIDRLQKLRDSHNIDQRTILKESVRRSLLAQDTDIEKVMADTKDEQGMINTGADLIPDPAAAGV
jgi:hypothetical protein